MSGIAGINWQDSDLIKSLTILMKTKNSKKYGEYIDNCVSLGCNGLNDEFQPKSNENETVFCAFIGNIYNYKELRAELIKKGHKFIDDSESEVIVHAYEEYGQDFVNKLNGKFNICIYDKKKQIIYLTRDRIGIMPIYYYFNNEKFIFSSDLKVIINYLKQIKELQVNTFAVDFYLFYRFPHYKDTPIKNAFKLEPGHYLIFDLKASKIKSYIKYWEIKYTNEIKDEDEAINRILNELQSSIARRINIDKPVACFLSGGVDTSAIVALTSRFTDNIHTFSVKFDNEFYDESYYANVISQKFNTNHHVIEFSAKDVLDALSKLPYNYDEPFADASMAPTFYASEYVSKDFDTILTGDGGDMMFMGTRKYGNILELEKLKRYRLLIRLPFFNKMKQNYYKNHFDRLNFNNENAQKYLQLESYQIFALFDSLKKINSINLEEDKEFLDIYKQFFIHKDLFFNLSYCDLHLYGPNDILIKVDRASRGNGLDTRSPFLDNNFVNLSLKIDKKLKIRKFERKYILKKAVAKIVPKEVIYRRKVGFGMPLKYYLKNELRNTIEEKVINFHEHSYFKRYNLEEIFKNHLEGKEDNSGILWTLLMYNLWYEKWILE
ncbi:asparagine synthase (glutamine-hydrolyzing) [Candidatus Harpocratesius sp.]